LYFPTGSNLDDHKITVLSAAPEANSLPFLAVSKQKTFSLCPKNKIFHCIYFYFNCMVLCIEIVFESF